MNQVAQLASLGEGVWFGFPQDAGEFSHGASGTPAVNQIGKKFPGLAPGKMKRDPVLEDFEVSEALHGQKGLLRLDCGRPGERVPQMVQGRAHGFLVGRLHQKPADIELMGSQGIFGVSGHEDDVGVAALFPDPLCKLQTAHFGHFNIQKNDIGTVTGIQPVQRFFCGGKTGVFSLEINLF